MMQSLFDVSGTRRYVISFHGLFEYALNTVRVIGSLFAAAAAAPAAVLF